VAASRQALIEVLPGRAGAVRTWFRGRGRPNNILTLMRMRQMVRASLGLDGNPENTELAQIADAILDAWNVRTGDEYEISEAVHYFIYNNISYTQDRAGGNERLQWPLETLRRRRGDCDDLEILEASLLGLCGIQDIWFEAAKYYEETEGEDHVYGFAKINSPSVLDGVLYHDSTATITEDKPLGWRAPYALEVIQVPVFEDEHNTLISTIGFLPIVPLISLGVNAISKLFGGGNDGGQKQAGKAFEDLAKSTVDYFNQIQQSGRAITVDEYNQAAAKLSGIAKFVEDYPFAYVTEKWNSDAYKPIFEQRLEQIKAVALATARTQNTGTGAGSVNTGTGSGGATNNNSDSTETLIEKYGPYALVALIAVLALKG
jgi:hypothetical protein